MPVDYDHFISERAKQYEPSAIRGLFPLELIDGMISLLAGKPNPETFPLESLVVNLKPLEGQEPLALTIDGKDLEIGLQYSATAGLPRLVKWIEALQSRVHQRSDSDGWRVTMGSGSQDSLSKAFTAIIDPGDSVLLETPCYPGTIGCLQGQPCDLVEVASDEEGIRPDALEDCLANWPKDKKFPKCIYTMPVGANPGGTTASEKRKLAILKLAKQYNLLLFEDDAYFYLYYGPEPQPRSYFALEGEANGEVGRVIRFDSFSKILSSGMRLGFTTAPKAFCDRVDLITANTNLQVSSLTQAIALALFKQWHVDGLLAHCRRVALFYKAKKDAFEAIAKKHLDGLASWTSPTAGMFLFLDLHIPSKDSAELIRSKAVQAGFLAVPGTSCMPSKGKSSCVRTSFSLATPEGTEEAFRRLAKLLREENGHAA